MMVLTENVGEAITAGRLAHLVTSTQTVATLAFERSTA